ncbi:growth inhibitor PemK [Gallibacterium salpingitidis]|uniref:Growth inhibitor PemK n=1 Tax=Gallibacterium salpingitidis TaxID=505341 RepID=A0AB36E3L2_9PAST|nr:type II toxin-antitoxin system PemK/MazF family toxin [Gallibacterium salpingitidis]OBX08208.1 growth inhibitor PemK [Gallibacterium salpingitidis]OBX11111.1 growth inhibitor PemK [Gallibacterium salpingitidis]WKT00976.1 type II toxin-antitoxin system PemK/MazF family toxin [Gallibacterium salpingitidis]
MKINFDRGDIVLIDFDPSLGGEIKGSRPALVISSKDFHKLGFALICPITQGASFTARNNGFAVPLSGTGCTTNGIVVAYQARIVDYRQRNIKRIEKAPDYITNEVQDIIDAIVHD